MASNLGLNLNLSLNYITFLPNKAQRGFGLLAQAAEPSEIAVVH